MIEDTIISRTDESNVVTVDLCKVVRYSATSGSMGGEARQLLTDNMELVRTLMRMRSDLEARIADPDTLEGPVQPATRGKE